MTNIFVNGDAASEQDLKRLLPADEYNVIPIATPTAAQGSVHVLKITCKLFKSPSLLDRDFEFLTKNGIYPITSRVGNFAQIEGGGYVFLDNVNCEVVN